MHVEGENAMTQDRRGKVLLVLPFFHELARILSSIERDDAPAVLVVPEGLTGVVAQAALSTGAGRIAAREHASGAALFPITQGCFFGSCSATRPSSSAQGL